MDVVKQAEAFEQKPLTFKTTSERIEASREVKALILGVNEIYKTSKDPALMDLMRFYKFLLPPILMLLPLLMLLYVHSLF
jgi:hypothetical protein